MILKYGGVLTHAGRQQVTLLFCIYNMTLNALQTSAAMEWYFMLAYRSLQGVDV